MSNDLKYIGFISIGLSLALLSPSADADQDGASWLPDFAMLAEAFQEYRHAETIPYVVLTPDVPDGTGLIETAGGKTPDVSAPADAGAGCVAGTGTNSTECGTGSTTGTANSATALGNTATATGVKLGLL